MATTEAPLEQMAFNEKAHPLQSNDILDTEMNGTNAFDAVLGEPAIQNGTHSDPMETSDLALAAQDPVASPTLVAEDENAAPVTQVSSGISPVATFLPDPVEETIADTTIPPPVEQPLSDLRSEPPEIKSPMLPTEPAPHEAGATNGDLMLEEPMSGETTSDENATLESIAAPEMVAEHTTPVVVEEPAIQDTMDTSEDVTDTAVAEGGEIAAQAPLPSVEASASPAINASMSESPAPQTSIFGSSEQSTGQVRQREEDDEEVEPVAKRAKTDTAGDALATAAPDAESSRFQVPATENQATSTEVQAPFSATENGASASSPIFADIKTDWDPNPMTTIQHRFLTDQIRKVKKVKFAQFFIKPVDPVALGIPTYPDIIKNPMDLETFDQKHRRHEYPTTDALMADFNLILINCKTFNGPAHTISLQGDNLRAYFYKNVGLLPKGEAAQPSAPPTRQPKKPSTPAPPKKTETRPNRLSTTAARSPVEPKSNVGFINADGTPIIRRDSSAQNDRPKREIVPPKRDLPLSVKPLRKKNQLELKFCEQVTAELFKKKYATFAYPFLVPVDPVALNIPNYHKIIKKPMDFSTIQQNLKTSQYNSAKEYYNDAQLVFQNCFKFNVVGDEVYKMGQLTKELFEKTWEGKQQYLSENAPASEPASDSEDESESEDEHEGESRDDKERRMLEIQRQIAALSAEAMNLAVAGEKRASPKAGAKKGKAPKAVSKPVKRTNSMVVPASKAAKPKAKPKVRKLSLEQKREVSEGIANLDEGQMRKAVQIIRNGVPSLREVNDDELELDIDEIPDAVVLELYDFVRRLRPRGAAPEVDDDDYTEPDTVHKPTSVNRKKNKPMKAVEQEERIKTLEALASQFQNGSGSEQQSPNNRQDESEDAEDDSEESEEE